MKEFRSLMFDGLSTEDALARSYVVDKDIFYSIRGRTSAAKMVIDGVTLTGHQVGWFNGFVAKDVNISFDLTPEEAVRYLRTKAFWISGIENDEVLKAIQKRLTEAANKGQTYQDFLDETEEYFKEMPKSRPQTVFRTNLYSAYSVAQLEQIEQMQDRFPLWRYIPILDSVTRPTHAAFGANGGIYRVGEGPYPPLKNGEDGGPSYNCRCTAQAIHTYQEPEIEKMLHEQKQTIRSGNPFTLSSISQHERSAFDAYLASKQAGMNPEIRGQVEADL